MEKPFTVKVQETEKQIVEVLNNCKLPTFVVQIILHSIESKLELIDNEEVEKYYKEFKEKEGK